MPMPGTANVRATGYGAGQGRSRSGFGPSPRTGSGRPDRGLGCAHPPRGCVSRPGKRWVVRRRLWSARSGSLGGPSPTTGQRVTRVASGRRGATGRHPQSSPHYNSAAATDARGVVAAHPERSRAVSEAMTCAHRGAAHPGLSNPGYRRGRFTSSALPPKAARPPSGRPSPHDRDTGERMEESGQSRRDRGGAPGREAHSTAGWTRPLESRLERVSGRLVARVCACARRHTQVCTRAWRRSVHAPRAHPAVRNAGRRPGTPRPPSWITCSRGDALSDRRDRPGHACHRGHRGLPDHPCHAGRASHPDRPCPRDDA